MRTKYLLINALLLCGGVSYSQQSSLLEKYRFMALEYSHDLKSADKNISASIELERAAKADWKPKLSGNANFQYTGQPLQLTLELPSMEQPMTFEGHDLKYGASLSLLQPIYTGGRILESIRMAGHRHSLASNQEELFRSAVCYQTDMQYWNTVARREIVDVILDYRNSISLLAERISERVEAGLVNQQELLMVEVKKNEAEYQLLQAKSEFETGRMALNSLIGVSLQDTTEIERTIPEVSYTNEIWISDGAERAELRMAYDQLKMTESASKLTESQYKPQLYVGLDGSYSSPGHDLRVDLDPNYVVYAKLSVPLFEWGKRRNEKRASTMKIGMANDQINKVEDQVNLEVQTARISFSQALERIALAESSLVKARENERMALERYAEGSISVVEVIEAQVYRQTSQLNYVQAKALAQGHYSGLIKALNKY